MITADQIVAHLVGDYLLQSDWMANEKTRQSLAAAAHALTYALPFLFLRPSVAAFAFIVATHFVIDRWRLARFVVYAKNFIAPARTEVIRYEESHASGSGVPLFTERAEITRWWHAWSDCARTGYHADRPVWLATWLLIIADNTMHLLCNGIALTWMN